MEIINNDYAIALRNQVRDCTTESDSLKEILFKLGNGFGQKIAEMFLLEEREVVTPMNEKHKGIHISNKGIVVISTRDDYEYFGNGISSVFPNAERGYMDFAGKRGEEALTCPLRGMYLPKKSDVEVVVVAKSVLATGCTAITLAKRAVENYNPKYLVIASVFYSLQGVEELEKECRSAEIIVLGDEDYLRKDGMLIPGFGDLDKRLNNSK